VNNALGRFFPVLGSICWNRLILAATVYFFNT
jgi:hypothetical protein